MYTSTDYRARRVLWQEMTAMIDQGLPTIVVNDFNCIDRFEEKMGGLPFMEDTRSKEFKEFIHTNSLVNLDFAGPSFTWYNNRSGGAIIWERIDRVFMITS